jgi:hypothetical protein
MVMAPFCIWKATHQSCLGYIRAKGKERHIWTDVCSPSIPLKWSFCVWLAIHRCLLTATGLVSWGILATTRYALCSIDDEDTNHLFFPCQYSSSIWVSVGEHVDPNSGTMQTNPTLPDLTSRDHLNFSWKTTTAIIRYFWVERDWRRNGEAIVLAFVLAREIIF